MGTNMDFTNSFASLRHSADFSDFLLTTNSLSKSYGCVEVLHDISTQIRQTEIVGLIGENGTDKSTFLKCLCGITKPSAGNFIFAGESYRSLHCPAPQLGHCRHSTGI